MMTNHSIERTVERVRLNTSQAKRMIDRAIVRGKTYSEFQSRERKYLMEKGNEEKYAVYYSGYCFVLSKDKVCITMFPVPEWFGKKRLYIGKEEIRKKRNFYKNYPDEYYADTLYSTVWVNDL